MREKYFQKCLGFFEIKSRVLRPIECNNVHPVLNYECLIQIIFDLARTYIPNITLTY